MKQNIVYIIEDQEFKIIGSCLSVRMEASLKATFINKKKTFRSYTSSMNVFVILISIDLLLNGKSWCDSLSDVPESRVCFASKNLTPCEMIS